jgi:hypothetical protein
MMDLGTYASAFEFFGTLGKMSNGSHALPSSKKRSNHLNQLGKRLHLAIRPLEKEVPGKKHILSGKYPPSIDILRALSGDSRNSSVHIVSQVTLMRHRQHINEIDSCYPYLGIVSKVK